MDAAGVIAIWFVVGMFVGVPALCAVGSWMASRKG